MVLAHTVQYSNHSLKTVINWNQLSQCLDQYPDRRLWDFSVLLAVVSIVVMRRTVLRTLSSSVGNQAEGYDKQEETGELR